MGVKSHFPSQIHHNLLYEMLSIKRCANLVYLQRKGSHSLFPKKRKSKVRMMTKTLAGKSNFPHNSFMFSSRHFIREKLIWKPIGSGNVTKTLCPFFYAYVFEHTHKKRCRIYWNYKTRKYGRSNKMATTLDNCHYMRIWILYGVCSRIFYQKWQ